MPDLKECALQRIQAYDKATGLNSYRLTSPNLSQAAAEKDSELAAVSADSSCTTHTCLETCMPSLMHRPICVRRLAGGSLFRCSFKGLPVPKHLLPLGELLFWQRYLRHEMQLAKNTLFVSSFLRKLKLHTSPFV